MNKESEDKARAEEVMAIYYHDASLELAEEIRLLGTLPVRILDQLITQDMITAFNLYLEELKNPT